MQSGVDDTYIPRSLNSRENVEEGLVIAQIPHDLDTHQEEARVKLVKPNADALVKSSGAMAGLDSTNDSAVKKKKRSVSMPRGGGNAMKRVTYELNKSEKFQKMGADEDKSDSLGHADDAPWNATTGTMTNLTSSRSPRGAERGGNEYAMTVISKVESGRNLSRDSSTDNPYYFKLQGESSCAVGKGVEGSDGLVRVQKSTSDASFASHFQLKKAFDKTRGKTSRQRQPKKSKHERPDSRQAQGPENNEYERLARDSQVDSKSCTVVKAEPDGEYSKLKRNATRDNGVIPTDGYDRISQVLPTTTPKNDTEDAFLGFDQVKGLNPL